MGCEGRKVYVEVNVTHRADGSARPNFIYFENDEKYEIDRVIQKCRAPQRSEVLAFAIRSRFADSRHFCLMKKMESGLLKQSPDL